MWTRLRSEQCASGSADAANAGSFQWTMDTSPFENASVCRTPQGLLGGPGVSYSRSAALVDVDSALRGIYFPASQCASLKFAPGAPLPPAFKPGYGEPPVLEQPSLHMPACPR